MKPRPTKKRNPPCRTFWQKVDRFPPITCRLVARKPGTRGRVALSTSELARETGLSEFQVTSISQQLDWTGVDLPTLRRFTAACGFDLENEEDFRRISNYLRGTMKKGYAMPPRFDYLKRSPEWKSLFVPLIKRLKERSK